MPGPIAPLLPVLLGLAVVWTGAAVVLYAGGRMRGRAVRWELVAGFGLCAVGPALPELGIAVAVARGGEVGEGTTMTGGLVLGTVLGSVLARSTLVLGLGAAAGAVIREPDPGPRTPPSSLLAVLLVVALAWDGALGWADGAILTVLGLLYLGWRVRATMEHADVPASRYGVLPDPFLVVTGLAMVAGSAWFLAPRAGSLAGAWGVAPMIPGLLVLGVGASLPELVLGMDAATSGRPRMSPSSVLANGTLGLLAPLGVAALLHPLAVPPTALRFDVPVLAVAVTCIWLMDRRGIGLSRRMGGVLVASFLVYAAVRIVSS